MPGLGCGWAFAPDAVYKIVILWLFFDGSALTGPLIRFKIGKLS